MMPSTQVACWYLHDDDDSDNGGDDDDDDGGEHLGRPAGESGRTNNVCQPATSIHQMVSNIITMIAITMMNNDQNHEKQPDSQLALPHGSKYPRDSDDSVILGNDDDDNALQWMKILWSRSPPLAFFLKNN